MRAGRRKLLVVETRAARVREHEHAKPRRRATTTAAETGALSHPLLPIGQLWSRHWYSYHTDSVVTTVETWERYTLEATRRVHD